MTDHIASNRSNGNKRPIDLTQRCPDDGCEWLFAALHRRIDELCDQQAERANTVDLAFVGVTSRLDALSRRSKRQGWQVPVIVAVVTVLGTLGAAWIGRSSKAETVDAVREAIAEERAAPK